MNRNQRPLSVTVLACVYLGVGAVGLVYHLPHSLAFQYDDVWIELTELAAIVCGVFMLQGRNWARWLALAWIAFHVVLSFGALTQLAVHLLFCAVIAWLLLRPVAARYFRGSQIEPA